MTSSERIAMQYLADGKSVQFASMMTGLDQERVGKILNNHSHEKFEPAAPEQNDLNMNEYLKRRNAEIIKRLYYGGSPAKLAEKYGLTVETVAMIGWRSGIVGLRRTKSIQLAAVTPQWPCGLPKAEWPRCGHVHNCYLSNKCGACK